MGRGTRLFLIILFVAPPNVAFVAFIVLVTAPCLSAEKVAATATDNPCREWRGASHRSAQFRSALHLSLHGVEVLGTDYGGMTVFNMALQYLTLILLSVFGEKVCGELLLQNRLAFVLLVGED